MRSFRHWTPRYIVNRLALMIYERSHPDAPWLTARATSLLETLLRPTDKGLEFGSGRSTTWFAKRVGHLTSVEHDEEWFARVGREISNQGLTNVDYILAPKDQPESNGAVAAYVRVATRFADSSLQFVLVDGVYRDACISAVADKVCTGGILVLDNANWWLPSASHSPGSRRLDQGPDGPGWESVRDTLRDWRSLWTSSGVTDTAFYYKP